MQGFGTHHVNHFEENLECACQIIYPTVDTVNTQIIQTFKQFKQSHSE